jgi:tRNA nucleotidyltransferase/poly(A) polymerase
MEKWKQIAREFLPKEFEGFKKSLSDGRRPDSVKFTTIEGDVLRRDLTINALFFDLDTQEIVDLVGGVEDLKNGIIRTVGNAKDRFNEDRLRILRAIRFAARFSNGLHSGIIDALDEDASLDGISSERIRDEFLKGLKSANSSVFFFEMLNSFNLFDWIFPNMVVNKRFIEEKDPIIQLATLLKNHEWGKLIKDLNKLTYTIKEIKGIEFLNSLRILQPENIVVWKNVFKFSGLSDEQVINFGVREGITRLFLEKFLEFELTVLGEDVMKEFNLKPSKELGDKIKELETQKFEKLLLI